MRNVAVMSGLDVLLRRVWLSAAFIYYQLKYFRSNHLVSKKSDTVIKPCLSLQFCQSMIVWTGAARG